VTTRNLYMLRETKPPAVLVELGNIRNLRDQMRLLKVNNRQALANWFTEGLIREAQ
jgi:N-acetylmuramoyl-L-alanine amidase